MIDDSVSGEIKVFDSLLMIPMKQSIRAETPITGRRDGRQMRDSEYDLSIKIKKLNFMI